MTLEKGRARYHLGTYCLIQMKEKCRYCIALLGAAQGLDVIWVHCTHSCSVSLSVAMGGTLAPGFWVWVEDKQWYFCPAEIRLGCSMEMLVTVLEDCSSVHCPPPHVLLCSPSLAVHIPLACWALLPSPCSKYFEVCG